MRRVVVFGIYFVPAVLLVWRAETYEDDLGRGLFLSRVMCIFLAVMIAKVGLTRSLESSGSDPSSE